MKSIIKEFGERFVKIINEEIKVTQKKFKIIDIMDSYLKSKRL